MTPILYSAQVCPFAHRTRLVLAEKAVAFELVAIDLQNRPADFKDISPYGKVPALVCGPDRLWESAVINEYLEEVYPEPALLPQTPAARALARIWIDFANTRLVPRFYGLLKAQEPEEQSTQQAKLHDALRFLEQEGLARSDGCFLFGDRPGLADFSLYPWFERWPVLEHYRGFPVPQQLTQLHAWRTAMQAWPSVRAEADKADFYIDMYQGYARGASRS